jgi:hypothetical protein
MQTFRPGRAPTDPKQLPSWLDRQMVDLQRAANAANDSVPLRVLSVEPTRPQPGLYVADGTNWNPGSGAGTYRYAVDATTGLGSYTFMESTGGGGADILQVQVFS